MYPHTYSYIIETTAAITQSAAAGTCAVALEAMGPVPSIQTFDKSISTTVIASYCQALSISAYR